MSRGVSFSPDGSQFVFQRHLLDRRQVALFIANADGGDVKEVAAIDYPENLEYPPGRLTANGSPARLGIPGAGRMWMSSLCA